MFCMETTLKRKLICKGNHYNHIKDIFVVVLYYFSIMDHNRKYDWKEPQN